MKAFLFKIKLMIIFALLGSMQFSYANNKDDVSLEQASETIRKDTKGQVLSATTSNYNGIKSHRIQVLTKSGRVKVYQVPANKNQTPKRYKKRGEKPNNSSNYRNIKSNSNSFNRNKTTTQSPQYNRNSSNPNSTNRNNSKKQNPQSRPQYNRNSSNRSNQTTLKKPSSSNKNGDKKKK